MSQTQFAIFFVLFMIGMGCGKEQGSTSSSAQESPQVTAVDFKAEWVCHQALRNRFLHNEKVQIVLPGTDPELFFLELHRPGAEDGELTLFSDRHAFTVALPESEKTKIYEIQNGLSSDSLFIEGSRTVNPRKISWTTDAFRALSEGEVPSGQLVASPLESESARADVVYSLDLDLRSIYKPLKEGAYKGKRERLRESLNLCEGIRPARITLSSGKALSVDLNEGIKAIRAILDK